jgi:hypothetical protein
MKSFPDKKYLIIAPIIGGGPYYWCSAGNGNTDDISRARQFSEEAAKELVQKEPLLKMVPAPI